MDVFRISRRKYIDDLTGTGAKIAGSRWNSRGVAVVYTAGHRSLAALELLVHVPQKNQLSDMVMATLSIPDEIEIKQVSSSALPASWHRIPPEYQNQAIGDEWIRHNKFCVLRVPSAIIRAEYNFLINPAHAEIRKIRIVAKEDFILDERLMSLVQ